MAVDRKWTILGLKSTTDKRYLSSFMDFTYHLESRLFFLKAAVKARKLLTESTKEFKKMTDAEKVLTVKDLIKSYQVIDKLPKSI